MRGVSAGPVVDVDGGFARGWFEVEVRNGGPGAAVVLDFDEGFFRELLLGDNSGLEVGEGGFRVGELGSGDSLVGVHC